MKYLYLMIKEHNITGKKYLCKKETDSDENAISYKGSGTVWKIHLKNYGVDIKTTILLKCNINETELFRQEGLRYSKQYDVVKSNDWLNLIVESGQGISPEFLGNTGKKHIYKGSCRKIVLPTSLPKYLDEGWIVGIPDEFKIKIGNLKRGIPSKTKGKMLKSLDEYKSNTSYRKHRIKTPSDVDLISERRRLTSFECLNRPEVKLKLKKPRKPLITAQNIITGEIQTHGRIEWGELFKSNYKYMLRGKVSRNWKMVVLVEIESTT